jgi:ATP-dependent exoDNAse (exonuclease V) beta subunit
LRGPLFALGDDQLLAFAHRRGKLHPLRHFGGGDGGVSGDREDSGESRALEDWEREVVDALAVIGRLHVGRNHRTLAETVGRLLAAVRAHAGIAIWPTGEQALANCLRLIDIARRFERGGASSFRAFVEYLEEQLERGEAQDAPAVEDGTDGVRLMTVHKSKGLEFPVVILADPTCKATGARATRSIDPVAGLFAEALCGCAPRQLQERADDELRRDRDEALRLAYVATTRARDLLVVPAVGDTRSGLVADDDDGAHWLDVLAPALLPPDELRRNADPAVACPPFGTDSVLRSASSRRGAGGSVRPGRHTVQAGGHEVVWWDPAVLGLDREEDVGLRQQKILEADEGGRHAGAGAQEHEQWQALRREALMAGARPSLVVRPVTKLVSQQDQEWGEREVAILEVPVDRRARPAGLRFGTLVHAVLAEVPLAADASQVAAVAALQGRVVAADVREIEAAAVAVRAALEHPLMIRAAACSEPGSLHRESPLLLQLEDGVLVEGIVDLAFREGDGVDRRWTVVDYKTDVEIEEHRSEYEAQVSLYAEAIERATGEPASAVLLRV